MTKAKNRIAIVAFEQAIADYIHAVEHCGPYSADFGKGMDFEAAFSRAALADPEATRRILREFRDWKPEAAGRTRKDR